MILTDAEELTPLDDAVAIIGGGSFARAVGRVLSHTPADVRMWARRKAARTHLKKSIQNVDIVDDLEEAVHRARLVVIGVSAAGLDDVASQLGPILKGDQVLLHGVRGVGEDFVLPHDVICRHTAARKIAVLGGPLYFDELKHGRPLVALVASKFRSVVDEIKALTQGTPVKVHGSHDVTGVELAGVMSNITHLATGLSNALKFGETARGVLATHGLSEAQILGVHLGAQLSTFSGLAGIADLIPRPIKATARHHHLAKGLVDNVALDKLLDKADGSVEGVNSVREAAELARKHKLTLPLINALDEVLFHGRPPAEAIEEVLQLDLMLGQEALRSSQLLPSGVSARG